MNFCESFPAPEMTLVVRRRYPIYCVILPPPPWLPPPGCMR
ncbi:hypothetical protein BN2364_0550 [Alloalcanivorax xenomutans]|nr:hypothetical protein BN2364_0550 [Alloalcanivorax xenomutans]